MACVPPAAGQPRQCLRHARSGVRVLQEHGHRADPLAGLQEERSGVGRAEERFDRAAAGGLRQAAGTESDGNVGILVSGLAVVHQLLPDVIQAEVEDTQWGPGNEALRDAADAARARAAFIVRAAGDPCSGASHKRTGTTITMADMHPGRFIRSAISWGAATLWRLTAEAWLHGANVSSGSGTRRGMCLRPGAGQHAPRRR